MFSLIIFILVISTVYCGPVPRNDVIVECSQGRRVFTVLHVYDEQDPRHTLLARCTNSEPARCVGGCEWLESCDRHRNWPDGQNGLGTIFVGGFAALADGLTETYCCESRGTKIDKSDCSWELPVNTRFSTAIANENQIIRNVKGSFADDIRFEVCRIRRQTIFCNPEDMPGEGGFQPGTGSTEEPFTQEGVDEVVDEVSTPTVEATTPDNYDE